MAREIAAASAAAYGVLVRLFPSLQSSLAAALAQSLAQVPDGGKKDEGVAVGDQVAAQIVALSRMTDEEYNAWLENAAANSRNPMAPDDTGAGGHSGPQPWQPITDTKVCDELSAELDQARETALSYPTPVEARAADNWDDAH